MIQVTMDQLHEIAERAATKAVELYVMGHQPKEFRSKSALARHLKKNRRTIVSMIERGEISITKQGTYLIK